MSQILKSDILPEWTDNPKRLEKEIREANVLYTFGDNGLVKGFIGERGLDELGGHSISFVYDISTGKLKRDIGIEG